MQVGQVTSNPPPNSGPEGDLFGTEMSMPTATQESPEQKLSRMGTEAYKTLNPAQYGSYVMGPDGKPQLVQFPQGMKPGPAIAPQSISVGVDAEGNQTRFGAGEKPFTMPQPKPKESKKVVAGSLNDTLHEYDNMINEAQAIKDDPSLGTATGMTSFMGAVPGTGAKRVAARLETLKAKTLLNVLGSMKQLSKTGASGFGQLSEIEGENIRNSVSTLDRKQSTADFTASLDRFIKEMQTKKQSLLDTFTTTYGPYDGGGTSSGIPDIGSLFQGHKVLSVKRVK